MSKIIIFNAWKSRKIRILSKIYWWFMEVVVGDGCDWNAWLHKSYLLHDNDTINYVFFLSNIQI